MGNWRLLGTLFTAVVLAAFLWAAEPPDVPVSGAADPNLAGFDKLMKSMISKQEIPGGALAIAKDGRIVYSRGFGYADRDKKEQIQPQSLFRIASISKTLTGVAVLQLVENKKIKLDDKVFDVLHLEAPKGVKFDDRWKKVTIAQLLHHTGGWDRDKSFDPMFHSPTIVKELKIETPADAQAIIRYMVRQPLDCDPGKEYHYSNFGYCLLGRVIEKVSGQGYEEYVRNQVLAPLGIEKMRLAKTLLSDRAEGEVRYYVAKEEKAKAILGPNVGKRVPEPYGAWNVEAMDAHGGWLASAEDLVRFASAFDNPKKCKILSEKSIDVLYSRPEGAAGKNKAGQPAETYYGCGWEVVVLDGGKMTTWHDGLLPGTSTLLVHRFDGLTWAVLFNASTTVNNQTPIEWIDGPLHFTADAVKKWPK